MLSWGAGESCIVSLQQKAPLHVAAACLAILARLSEEPSTERMRTLGGTAMLCMPHVICCLAQYFFTDVLL